MIDKFKKYFIHKIIDKIKIYQKFVDFANLFRMLRDCECVAIEIFKKINNEFFKTNCLTFDSHILKIFRSLCNWSQSNVIKNLSISQIHSLWRTVTKVNIFTTINIEHFEILFENWIWFELNIYWNQDRDIQFELCCVEFLINERLSANAIQCILQKKQRHFINKDKLWKKHNFVFCIRSERKQHFFDYLFTECVENWSNQNHFKFEYFGQILRFEQWHNDEQVIALN